LLRACDEKLSKLRGFANYSPDNQARPLTRRQGLKVALLTNLGLGNRNAEAANVMILRTPYAASQETGLIWPQPPRQIYAFSVISPNL